MESKQDRISRTEVNRPIMALKAHLSINVRSIEESVQFYRKLFGIEPSKVRTGYAKFDLQNPPLNLALNEAAVTNRGANHWAFDIRQRSRTRGSPRRAREPGLPRGPRR